jgi:Protein of unknown function (DUF3465)
MSGGSVIGAVVLVLAAFGAGWYLRDRWGANMGEAPGTTSTDVAPQSAAAGPALVPPPAQAQPQSNDPLQRAIDGRARGEVLAVRGKVQRILADDRDESPHQRFIIVTDSGHSLLIAHNLDLAQRLQGLAPGDVVTVLGEYEWNEKGGVMHWTHDDPQSRHVPGYIEWHGKRYQ